MLLVGETGTGKTTAVQHLARSIGKELLVHNLSEQSDSSELIGGYRPVQMRHIFAPLASRFEAAFCSTFSRARNAALLDKLAVRLAKGEWKKLIQIMNGALRTVRRPSRRRRRGRGVAGASGGLQGGGGGPTEAASTARGALQRPPPPAARRPARAHALRRSAGAAGGGRRAARCARRTTGGSSPPRLRELSVRSSTLAKRAWRLRSSRAAWCVRYARGTGCSSTR